MVDEFEVAVATTLSRHNVETNTFISNDFNAIFYYTCQQCLCYDFKFSSLVANAAATRDAFCDVIGLLQ